MKTIKLKIQVRPFLGMPFDHNGLKKFTSSLATNSTPIISTQVNHAAEKAVIKSLNLRLKEELNLDLSVASITILLGNKPDTAELFDIDEDTALVSIKCDLYMTVFGKDAHKNIEDVYANLYCEAEPLITGNQDITDAIAARYQGTKAPCLNAVTDSDIWIDKFTWCKSIPDVDAELANIIY